MRASIMRWISSSPDAPFPLYFSLPIGGVGVPFPSTPFPRRQQPADERRSASFVSDLSCFDLDLTFEFSPDLSFPFEFVAIGKAISFCPIGLATALMPVPLLDPLAAELLRNGMIIECDDISAEAFE